MGDGIDFLGFLVEVAPGGLVVVKVFSHDGQLRVVRVVSSWADLAVLGAEYGVPEARWAVDEDAQAALDATDAPGPDAA